MAQNEVHGTACVYGYCSGCGGEVYLGEFCFRLDGRLYCGDCVREGRSVAGEEDCEADLLPHGLSLPQPVRPAAPGRPV